METATVWTRYRYETVVASKPSFPYPLRHSRESGNPGVLEGGYAVFPRSTPPGFPLSRE